MQIGLLPTRLATHSPPEESEREKKEGGKEEGEGEGGEEVSKRGNCVGEREREREGEHGEVKMLVMTSEFGNFDIFFV
jgi:hypothetical protein